jgi:hypothetical protein
LASDPDLLDAFRKQCETVQRALGSPWMAFVAWIDQPSVERDDLIDIAKDVEAHGPERGPDPWDDMTSAEQDRWHGAEEEDR